MPGNAPSLRRRRQRFRLLRRPQDRQVSLDAAPDLLGRRKNPRDLQHRVRLAPRQPCARNLCLSAAGKANIRIGGSGLILSKSLSGQVLFDSGPFNKPLSENELSNL